MKNFVRALRHAWPYRRRIIFSIIFAIGAAVFWSLNFTSIYPALKLLNTEQSLQQWIDGRIDNIKDEIEAHQKELAILHERERNAQALPDSNEDRDKLLRDLARPLAQTEGKLEAARTSLYRSHIAKKYIYKFLPTDCYQTLVWLIVAVLIGIFIKCVFEFLQESLVGNVVNLTLFDLRNRFFRHSIHQDVNQFTDQGSSELMARFTNDAEALGTGIRTLFGKVIAQPLRVLSCLVVACYISWQLTLLFLVVVPVAVFILTKVTRIMKRATRRVLDRMSNIYKILQETFQGIRVVKAFTMEPYERRRFHEATREYYHKAMRVVYIDAISGPIIEVLAFLAVGGALLAGSYLVLYQQTHLWGLRMSDRPLDAETLLQLYILLAAISDPVRKLSSVVTRIQSAFAASDRIFEYLDRHPSVSSNPDGVHVSKQPRILVSEANPEAENPPTPLLEFRDVCFSYEPGENILTNISLQVQEGETIALVGPNGCGKSTLVGLLPRFYDPDHGTILLDGHDLRNLHLRGLRQTVGIVTQKAVLFEDTIYNNIAYGKRGATDEEVEEAARRALAHDFISQLPEGYQTRLGERARNVSGGEMQRVALARAILRNPRLLILDEFTSNYDTRSEAEVHQTMKHFMKERTTIVITHRLNTLEIADRIVVIDEGRIIAVGTHTELMSSCPLYQKLHHHAQDHRLSA